MDKDNNITIGYTRKKTINAMLNNFLADFKNNIRWPREDVYTLQGQLGYLKHIEPNYFNYLINKYEDKYKISYSRALSISLRNN